MQLEVIEIGQHLKVSTREMVHAIFLKAEGSDVIIEARIDADTYEAVLDLLAREGGDSAMTAEPGQHVVTEPASIDGKGAPPGFEGVFDHLPEDMVDPPAAPGEQAPRAPTYVDQAIADAAAPDGADQDEDGFSPATG